MTIMLDSATAPTPAQLNAAHAGSVTWAGYLHSPTTYRGGWPPAALFATAHVLGSCLPVWVGPLGATSAAQGAADARTVLAQLDAAHLSHVVALDTEAGATSKPGALAYARAFHAGIHAAHGRTVQYGPLSFLAQLARLTGPERPDGVWLAKWLGGKVPNLETAWPVELASVPPVVRGWQYVNDRPAYGVNVDLSVVGAGFPVATVLAPPQPQPPQPHPVSHSVAVMIDGRTVAQGTVTL
ncbi:MAG TPA: hypothetical protein VLS51_08550 [Propionibacteriaceae bacterium]|nr:hypothetical protein [Propionibacteriaceae bacterium]